MFRNKKPGEASGSHLYLRLGLLAVLTLVITMSALYSFVLVARVGRVEHWSVEDAIYAEVVYPNGWSERVRGNQFPTAYPGYTIHIKVPLPEEQKVENAALCFELPNNIVEVTWNDQLLTEVGKEQAAAGRQIGHQVIVASIPDEAWGDAVMVTAYPQEHTGTSQLYSPMILKATDTRMYTLIRRQFDFLIFITLLVFSSTALIAFLLASLLGFRRMTQGIFLSLFLMDVCVWYISYQGLFFVFSNNPLLWAELEDVTLFLLPIPFLAYIRRENVSRKLKRTSIILEIVFGVIFMFAAVMNYLPLPLRRADLIAPMRVILLAAMVMIISILLSTKPEEEPTLSDKVLRYGLVVSITVASLEVVRITLSNMPFLADIPFVQVYTRLMFTRVMILIFLFVLVASFGLRLAHLLRQDLEHRQLETLAYTDMLTGIPNRQDCERNVHSIGERERMGCAVLFFDSNDLKMANDHYGHEAGDELLRRIGDALAWAMKDRRGFYGRYGGDEFIACVYHSEEVKEVRRKFFREIEGANRMQVLPFPISVACGTATYQELREAAGGTPTMEELIHLADARMYEDKLAMKKARAE